MTFPVGFGIGVAILFDIPASEMGAIFLSPLFYLVGALAIVTGLALWEVKRWAWHLLMFTNIWVLYETAYIAAHFGSSHHKILALFSVVILIGVFAYRITSEVRVPYFFPRIRWWETGSRGFCAIAANLKSAGGAQATGEMMDLSMGGCFIKTPENFLGEDRVTVSFEHARQVIQCQGMILWRANSTVTSPRGLGIRFLRLERAQRRMLRIVIHRIRREQRRASRVGKRPDATPVAHKDPGKSSPP